MSQNTQMHSQRTQALRAVARAYTELIRLADRQEGVAVEDLQAATEYLLDAIKTARLVGCRQFFWPKEGTGV